MQDEKQSKLEKFALSKSLNKIKNVPVSVAAATTCPRTMFTLFIVMSFVATLRSAILFEISDPVGTQQIGIGLNSMKSNAFMQSLSEYNNDDTSTQETQGERSQASFPLEILLIAPTGPDGTRESGSVFTLPSVQLMKTLEEKIYNTRNFTDFCARDFDSELEYECLPPFSPTKYLKNSTTQEQLKESLIEMYLKMDDAEEPTKHFFSKDFATIPDTNNKRCTLQRDETGKITVQEPCKFNGFVTRIVVSFGLPLKGFQNSTTDLEKQKTILLRWLNQQVVPILDGYMSAGMKDSSEILVVYGHELLSQQQALVVLNGDMKYVVGSILFVSLVLLSHTQSLFLALLGVLQILMSFPVSYYFYRVLLGYDAFTGLHVASLFIALGIGCDDCIVYTDAVKQSKLFLLGEDVTFTDRLSWAYNRACFTMFSTTFTTAAAFLTLALSNVTMISTFGVFAALLVSVNFVLVITLYTSTMVLFHLYFESDSWGTRVGPTGKAEIGSVESFFHNVISERFATAKKVRRTFLALIMPVLIVFVYYAVQLDHAENWIDLFPKGHPLRWYFDYAQEPFSNVSPTIDNRIHVVWGIEDPYIRSAPQSNDNDSVAYISQEHFDISTPKSQQFLRNYCYEVSRYDETQHELELNENIALSVRTQVPSSSEGIRVVNGVPATCAMAAFAKWREELGLPFPVPTPAKTLTKIGGEVFPSLEAGNGETFMESFQEFLSRPQFGYSFGSQIEFVESDDPTQYGRIRRIHQSFEVGIVPNGDAQTKRNRLYDAWTNVIKNVTKMSTFPNDTLGEPYFTNTDYFALMEMQNTMVDEVEKSLYLSLLLGFFVTLFASNNYIISTLTTICMGGILLSVAAIISMCGWGLGQIELTSLTIVVGFSVDYLIHLAIAYKEASEFVSLRDDRVTYMLTTMGVSVLTGAISTSGAALFLLFTTITFVTKFGLLILSTVLVSVIFALLVFPALLGEFGPEHDYGSFSFRDCLGSFVDKKGREVLDDEASASSFDDLEDGNGSKRQGRASVERNASFAPNLSLDSKLDEVPFSEYLLEDTVESEGADECEKDFSFESSDAGSTSAFSTCSSSAAGNIAESQHGASDSEPMCDLQLEQDHHGHAPTTPKDNPQRRKCMLSSIHLFAMLMATINVWLLADFISSSFHTRVIVKSAGSSSLTNTEPQVPRFSSLVPNQWTAIVPGKNTVCARGSEYEYYVKPGTNHNGVVIQFEGGGACWSRRTCQAITKTFTDSVDHTKELMGRIINGTASAPGIADENGPYANYTHIYIPYCTGDLHWGNATAEYSDSVTIEHKGAVNTQAVLDWLYDEVPEPERILVTGCSAGAYASVMWGAHIAKHYKDAGAHTKVLQLADSGLGVVTPEFMTEGAHRWKFVDGAFPHFVIPSNMTLNLEEDLNMVLVYKLVSQHFPMHTFSQYSTAYDWNQVFFYKTQSVGFGGLVSGVDLENWNTRMKDMYSNSTLSSMPANYRHLTGLGDYHCNINYARHWWVEVTPGVPFHKLLYEMFENQGATNSSDVVCEDSDCEKYADLRPDFVLS